MNARKMFILLVLCIVFHQDFMLDTRVTKKQTRLSRMPLYFGKRSSSEIKRVDDNFESTSVSWIRKIPEFFSRRRNIMKEQIPTFDADNVRRGEQFSLADQDYQFYDFLASDFLRSKKYASANKIKGRYQRRIVLLKDRMKNSWSRKTFAVERQVNTEDSKLIKNPVVPVSLEDYNSFPASETYDSPLYHHRFSNTEDNDDESDDILIDSQMLSLLENNFDIKRKR